MHLPVGIGGKAELGARFAAKRFNGADQLQVVEAAGDAAIAVGVICKGTYPVRTL